MSRTPRKICDQGHDLTVFGERMRNGGGKTFIKCRGCNPLVPIVRGDRTARNSTYTDGHIPYMEPLPDRITDAARQNILTLWPDEAPDALRMLGLAA